MNTPLSRTSTRATRDAVCGSSPAPRRTRTARRRLTRRHRTVTRLSAIAVFEVLAVVAMATPVLAETAGTVLAVNDLPTVIGNLTKWIVGISATVATFFLTWGFLRYMTAGGDPGQLEKAKAALRNAAIGYAGTLLAPVLVTILQQILGA
jgi:hypothetical protein